MHARGIRIYEASSGKLARGCHQRERLTATQPGQYWSFVLRAQNAVLLLFRCTSDQVNVCVWEVQPPNREVMRSNGSLSQVSQFGNIFSCFKTIWQQLFLEHSTFSHYHSLERGLPTFLFKSLT
jgi:hypothetical protein